MFASKTLNFIGKGQITIPVEWRMMLGLDKDGAVKSELQGNKIVIEKLSHNDQLDWNTEKIMLNELEPQDQKLIEQGRKAYAQKETDKFLGFDQFFA